MAITKRQTNETLRSDMWRASDTSCAATTTAAVAGFPLLTFVSAGDNLLAAAQTEQLRIENPNLRQGSRFPPHGPIADAPSPRRAQP